MSIFGSWVITLAFFFMLFLAGKYLQTHERGRRLTKRAEDAIRRGHLSDEPSLGTRYGNPTQYERRRSGSV
jgi:hypothetical protein